MMPSALELLLGWMSLMILLKQILKPAEKKQKYVYGGMGSSRPVTPPRKQKK